MSSLMEIAIIVALALVFVVVVARELIMQRELSSIRNQLRMSIEGTQGLIQQQLGAVQTQLNDGLKFTSQTLQSSNADIGKRLDQAAQVFATLQKQMGEVSSTLSAVGEIKDIFKAPKLRGGFGELFLNDLLAQILPQEHFSLQYEFKDTRKVDAVVRLGGRLVPIDSKFPLENFQKLLTVENDDARKQIRRQFAVDVKKHIDSVASYILPDEGTYDFALMYIAAENIYYEVAVKSELVGDGRPILEYAMERKVVPVSPNTIYLYLYTVALGLKGFEIEKHAKILLEWVGRVQLDLSRFSEDFALIGRHLTNAHASFDKADKRLSRFEERLVTFTEDRREALSQPKEGEAVISNQQPVISDQ